MGGGGGGGVTGVLVMGVRGGALLEALRRQVGASSSEWWICGVGGKQWRCFQVSCFGDVGEVLLSLLGTTPKTRRKPGAGGDSRLCRRITAGGDMQEHL